VTRIGVTIVTILGDVAFCSSSSPARSHLQLLLAREVSSGLQCLHNGWGIP